MKSSLKENIKIGVSLYSLSTPFIHEWLDLEGCLRAVHEMGYKGVEIVAAQMVPGYPFPTDEWLFHFRGLLEQYELEPVCWSAYVDMGIRTDRDLTEAEMRPLGIETEAIIEVDFEVGDTVSIIAGAWKDTVGVIQAMNEAKQTVTINVQLFGRETPVEINFAQVKKIV